jgi:protein-tyrosine phosphatase
MGNICRSPAADNTFKHLLDSEGLGDRIRCDSAGTIDYHTGKSPDARMGEVLKTRGIPVRGAARPFQAADLARFDLILTMDEENRADVLSLAGDSEQEAKVRRFTDFCEGFDTPEVPDPYYGGTDGFELVADMIADGCDGLLAHILQRLES